MILVHNISKSYKKNLLFKDLSFQINSGQKVCFTAQSGKGKSTLLNILMGLESFENGGIQFKNTKINSSNIKLLRVKIAWLPQELAINIETGEELIMLMDIDKTKFENYLEKLHISKELLKQKFQSLSGGQKQRMLLASCLSLEKEILILDEPTSALGNKSISILIKTVLEKENLTVISASHNQEWINACTKIIEL
ncbi:MAG: ATP-binding cassette domain-containing protein [Methanosarcinales archaeon]|nr:ATP-binding cassette domain-containing protein [Methanosarcinales archaeon]